MAESYDVVLATPFPNYNFFAHKMRELCGQNNLTFFFCNDTWVKEFHQKLQAREVEVKVLLDLTANQRMDDDPYVVLAREVKRQRGTVIDDPDITAQAAHKGYLQHRLEEARVPVPPTIVVPREDIEQFELTRQQKSYVGVPFVVKPAWGDSGVGVVVNAYTEDDLLTSAAQAPNSDAFLIQKRVEPTNMGNHVGWFRLFHIFKEVIPCWWNPYTHEYQMVTPGEMRRYRLTPLRNIMREIGRISQMKKFTSEICLHQDGKFYVVDYVNADPDMNPRSFYANGVPDEIVRHIVWLLFYEAMHIVKRGHGYFDDELMESEADRNWLQRRQQEQASN